HELGAALEQHDLAVCSEGVGGNDAGGHARERRIDRGLERAVDECAPRQEETLRRQKTRRRRGRRTGAQQRREGAVASLEGAAWLLRRSGLLHLRARMIGRSEERRVGTERE